jgi:hypothetical protein
VFAPLKKGRSIPSRWGFPSPFPALLKIHVLLDTCKLGKYMAAAIDRCRLYPINVSRGM